MPKWFELTRAGVSEVDGHEAPTRNDQYLLFQTLLGTWPDPAPATAEELASYRDRIIPYMEKATKEAKQHTSWISPNEKYDQAVRLFVEYVISDTKKSPFLESFLPFAQQSGVLRSVELTVSDRDQADFAWRA